MTSRDGYGPGMAPRGEACIVNDRTRPSGPPARWCVVGVVLTSALVALSAPPVAAQTPTPHITWLSIDPPSPSPGQVVTVQVVCDHSGPVAFDDIDLAARVAGGAVPESFQDDTASHGGSEWTARSDTPLPGAGIHAVRVGTFTWQGNGDGTVTAICSSSLGSESASLSFSSAPPVTDASGSTVVPPPTFRVVPPTAPRARPAGLPSTGQEVTTGLWAALAALAAGLVVLLARRRAVALQSGAESPTAVAEPPSGRRWLPRARR